MRGRRIATLLVCAALTAACTGGGSHHPSPPPPTSAPGSTTTSTVEAAQPSVDRIQLGRTQLGGPESCLDDAYCAAGLSRVYGINLGTRIFPFANASATVAALTAGAIDVAALPRSEVGTTPGDVVTLRDDLNLAPADNLVPIASGALLQATPALVTALDAVSTALDQTGLDGIERSIAQGTTAANAADQWLQAHPVVPPTAPANATPLVIGARSDPENAAVAAIYAAVLGRGHWNTTVDSLDGDRADELDAFDSGHIAIAIENVAPLLEWLAGFTGAATADLTRSMTLLRSALVDIGLRPTTPSLAADGTAFAVAGEVARTLSLTTLSDLARASGARTGAPVTPPSLPATHATPVIASLGVGSSGAAVLALQQKLISLGYAHLLLTQTFDEATRREVVAFQTDAGVIANGVDDAPTQRALAAAAPTSRPSSSPAPGDPASLSPPPTAVYLAFAGGPSSFTPQILDLLHRHADSATFFVDDQDATHHADVLHTIVGDGDSLGVSMPPHLGTSPIAVDVMWRTVGRTRDDLSGEIGQTTTCVLAPYGATQQSAREPGADQGFKVALWDIDPQDWRRPGATVITNSVLDNVQPGDVVLLHDGGGDRSQTVSALGPILDALAARGYTVSALSGCNSK